MIYFIFAFLIVLADQVVKYAVTLQFGQGGQWDIIPGIMRITYHTNSGGAFSMLDNYTLWLSIASAVVCIVIIIALIRCRWSALGKLSLAFILGGAIGNLIDRFVMGYVVDMFYPLFVSFAIFNVADIFITIGAVLLVLFILFGNKHPDQTRQTASERKQAREARKYGPDIDESTIVIPADDIRAAEAAMHRDTADEIEADAEDATMIYHSPVLTDSDISAAEAQKQSREQEEKSEYTLEDIMKEYGHGI